MVLNVKRDSPYMALVTRIIMDNFECKNKCLPHVAKLYVGYRPIGNFIEIPCTKFQQCVLLTYFVTVDLVM